MPERIRFLTFSLALVFVTSALLAQQPVIIPAWNVDQGQLEQGKYTPAFVLQAGQRFFTTPYLRYNQTTGFGDGYGEGPNGPRWTSRLKFYRGVQYGWPFLRLNGLDSQSCYECHNTIGSYILSTQNGGGFNRKPGTAGGSAGSNSNAYINSTFPNPLTYFVRNPPHTFGTAYTQTLADEMTWELLQQVFIARVAAKTNGGQWVTVNLSAKGLSFGSMRTMYNSANPGTLVNCPDAVNCDPGGLTPYAPPAGYTDDTANLTGVSCDYVVRPFQWKGISSSIRHFARDALDFHFSMQAVEKYAHLDCDLDGKTDEMTIGNVSALATLVAMTRPPQQVFPNDPQVQRGRAIFMGTAPGLSGQMCATCHVASMPLYTQQLFIDNPGVASMEPSDCKATGDTTLQHDATHVHFQTLGAPNSIEDHPAFSRLGIDPATRQPPVPFAPKTGLPCPRPQGPGSGQQSGYCLDLTNLPPDVPEHVLPRLARLNNNVINVPLFSDLRTHDMGPALADADLSGTPLAQGTDVAGLCIQSPMFVTRPLWGVGDTGPWMHDGRATTLLDAITLHAGEATPIINAFNGLSAADQQSVVTFLLSLQLPCVNSINCPPVPLGQSTASVEPKPEMLPASP